MEEDQKNSIADLSSRYCDPDFAVEVGKAKMKCGKMLLIDEDLMLLALDEISRTCTHEEKNYSA